MVSTRLFSAQVARKLGHYVYLYVDPRDGRVFYVGKGKANRAFAHLARKGRSKIARRIREIRHEGREPEIEILAHALPDDATALKVEAAAIDLLGMDNLCNEQQGHESRQYGRRPVAHVAGQYTRRPANIKEPAILIRINNLFRHDMTPAELYDATRSAWKVANRKDLPKFAMAVFEGVIREVYEISGWVKGGTTFVHQREGRRAPSWNNRFEFIGTLADEKIHKKYVNKFVGDEFPQGAQNPIKYVNLERLTKNRKPSRKK